MLGSRLAPFIAVICTVKLQAQILMDGDDVLRLLKLSPANRKQVESAALHYGPVVRRSELTIASSYGDMTVAVVVYACMLSMAHGPLE